MLISILTSGSQPRSGVTATLELLRISRRERQVMALVVSGLLNKQVGDELGISKITEKAHRAQVMQKRTANSLADLVRMATKLSSGPRIRQVRVV